MKEKGFTLIELPAVIVILAIIALIAVPIIIDIIEDSKKEALKRSAENYLKAVELAIAKENLNSEFNPTSCTIESGITKCGDKTLNVTVDGELPQSGEIKLSNGTIEKISSTTLKYKSGTLTYKEGKLTIEEPKKELIAEGTIISETTNGVAVNVDNQLVYYVPYGSNEAIVYGYRGNIDYSDTETVNGLSVPNQMPQTSGSVEIASKVKINDVTYNVTKIGDYAFRDCTNLNSIEIPSSVTSIGYQAIQGCTNLSSITIPESVTSINNQAFANCTSLSSIEIPSSVISIGSQAFQSCTNLSNIIIPENVEDIGYYAFAGTPWLTLQQQSSENRLVVINSILIDGTSATGDVIIPDGVTKIAMWAFCIGGMMGANITSVTIPPSVTIIEYQAFYGKPTLTININKPSGSIEGSPWGAFAGTVNWQN